MTKIMIINNKALLYHAVTASNTNTFPYLHFNLKRQVSCFYAVHGVLYLLPVLVTATHAAASSGYYQGTAGCIHIPCIPYTKILKFKEKFVHFLFLNMYKIILTDTGSSAQYITQS